MSIGSILEVNYNFKTLTGPSDQELTGLNMDERKRRRVPNVNEFMEIEGGNGLAYSETIFSNTDYAASSMNYCLSLLCRLARQNECLR